MGRKRGGERKPEHFRESWPPARDDTRGRSSPENEDEQIIRVEAEAVCVVVVIVIIVVIVVVVYFYICDKIISFYRKKNCTGPK